MIGANTQTSKWAAPYPAYKDSGVEWLGEVPAHWRVDRVKWATTGIINGVWGDEPDGDDDLICVRVADFNRDKFVVADNPPTLRSVSLSNRQGRLLQSGDLLIEKSGGGDKQLVGCVVLFEHAFNAVCSNFIARMRVLEPNSARFWCYIYAALYASRLNYPAIKQTTGIQNLDTTSYFETRVGYPPIDEQRAIAAFLDRETEKIDTLVAKKRTLIERLKEERTALITHTVTRGLPPEAARAAGLEPHPNFKPSGVEWLGDVPAHWDIVPISRIAETIQTGPFGSQLHAADYTEGGIPLINPVHIIAGRLIPDERSAIDGTTALRLIRHRLRVGDIVMARRGEIGRCGVVGSKEAGWMCGTGSLVIRLQKCAATYYAIIFSNTGFSQLLNLQAVGTTMANLNPTIIGRMLVPAPPLSEQRAIADFLDRETEKIDTLATKIETAIERLQEYRSALITAAVTGKIDVREDREKELTSKSFENTEGGKFLTSIDKKKADILNSARDKNFYDEDFLKDYNILNFYENASSFVGLRSLFPNSFSEDGIDLQNLKKEYRKWMQLNENKDLFERSIRYERGRHFKKYVEAAKKSLSSKCLEPNCQKKAIGSHLISQKYLKFISCKDNKVREVGLFTDPKKMADDFENKIRKNPFILIEHILNPESNQFKDIEKSSEKFGAAVRKGRSSRLTPIHYASQFYGYCSKHDSEIYRCFENNDFDPNNRQHLNLIVKRTFDYLYRHIDETCKLRPQELLDTAKNNENYFRYIKSIFTTRQAFDNPNNMRDDFFHLMYIVRSKKPPVIACSRDLSLHASLIREASESNNIKKNILKLCRPMFLNIFPIKETETLVCLSFFNGLYFHLFTNQSQSEDIALEDLRNAFLSNNEKRINKELSKLILDRADTLYLREEFYQTLMRKGFKKNLSDFMPTDELNFLNY